MPRWPASLLTPLLSVLLPALTLGLTITSKADDVDTWWSLKPLANPAPPRQPSESGNAIDAFLVDRLSRQGQTLSRRATRRVLARRLSFDLLGIPASPEAVSAFVNDPHPDAWSRLVDRTLANPHFGERWARHWLDIVRYGESQGFERDKLRPHAWRYRDWVVSAFNADMPYNRFAAWQIAGDVLEDSNPDAVVAAGFLVAGPWDEVGNSQQSDAMKRVVRQDELEDLVSVVGQGFLALTVHCARCHDHKFDPIPQAEYYRMASALDGVRHGLRDLPGQGVPERTSARSATMLTRRRFLEERLAQLESAARHEVLKARKTSSTTDAQPPAPFARWDFNSSDIKEAGRDSFGRLHGVLHGDGKLDKGHLVLGIRTHIVTPPIPMDVSAKTLEAWVQLADTRQTGGGLVAVEAINGSSHDAIAFGDLVPGHWNVSSEQRRRTVDFRGPRETDGERHLVHIAYVFDETGRVTAYRNGQQYGQTIRTRGPIRYRAGEARVLIGLRHSPSDRARHIRGRIDRVQLHLRALSPEEIIRSSGSFAQHVSDRELLEHLTEKQRETRDHLLFEIKQLSELAARWNAWKAYTVVPRPPGVTRRLVRGNPADPAEIVTPGGVSAVPGPPPGFGLAENATDTDRRRALASWITSKANPLFARVIVNRVWMHHFGRGLVETPSDFGINGGLPSHPRLLDWLASQLISHHFQLKPIHRIILNSRAYQQASRYRPEAAATDADNRLIWRMTPRRLEAEALRDAMLSASGSLDHQIGGPGFYDFSTHVNNSQFYAMKDPIGATFDRRSLYRTVVRSGRSPFLDAFDCPDPSTKSPRRAITTTPLQALSLLNSNFAIRMSHRLARLTVSHAGPAPQAQVQTAYRLCFSRPPTTDELKLAVAFVSEHGMPAFARVLFNSNEFLYVD